MALFVASDLTGFIDSEVACHANSRQTTKPDLALTLIFAKRREEAGYSMKKQVFRERECIHRDEVDGEFYNGVFYVQALQRLPVDQAMQVTRKVGSFFRSDAPHILVWLCHSCAAELHLTDTPRAMTQSSRRQA
jgi:hypothetical protein